MVLKAMVKYNNIMQLFQSVRSKILIISLTLVLIFLMVYTVSIWTVADSYALTTSAQNLSFSFSLLYADIEKDLANVSSLVRRISIDTELKLYLTDSDTRRLYHYYDEIGSIVESNPAFGILDRFIVTNSTMTSFLQLGGMAVSTGLPLRRDNFLEEIDHIEEENLSSGIFSSSLTWYENKVIGYLLPIIDYNTGRTIGHVYASVNVDLLLASLYAFARANDGEFFFTFKDETYRVDDGGLTLVSGRVNENARTLNTPLDSSASLYSLHDGRFALTYSASPDFEISGIFKRPSIFSTTSPAPYVVMLVFMAVVIIILGIVLTLFLNRAIYRPVKKLAGRIEKIPHSDFSQDEEIETKDEFGIIGHGINKLSSEVVSLMDKRVEDERKKFELEYRMLQNQINPHFLYNTFNAIKWMAQLQGASGISEMITSLARIMKNISKGEADVVSLSQEISFINDYMVIMKYRYGNTIAFYKNIHSECENLMIPRFTLQPLVENAIFHGLEPRGKGALSIVAQDFGTYTTIMVADNGVGFKTDEPMTKGDGVFRNIGLDNIRQRLAYSYEERVEFEISSAPGLYTRCTIKIKKED